jgi:hypothetical protein
LAAVFLGAAAAFLRLATGSVVSSSVAAVVAALRLRPAFLGAGSAIPCISVADPPPGVPGVEGSGLLFSAASSRSALEARRVFFGRRGELSIVATNPVSSGASDGRGDEALALRLGGMEALGLVPESKIVALMECGIETMVRWLDAVVVWTQTLFAGTLGFM